MGEDQIWLCVADCVGDDAGGVSGRRKLPIWERQQLHLTKISQSGSGLVSTLCGKRRPRFRAASGTIGGNHKMQPVAACRSASQKPIHENFQIIGMRANRHNLHVRVTLCKL
jgi:hypothetical protein